MQANARQAWVRPFCGSGLAAFGALAEARANGPVVPKRLAVCGAGDFELSPASDPPFTIVSLEGAWIRRDAAAFRLPGTTTEPRVQVPFRIVEPRPPDPVGVARRCYRYHRWCRGMPPGSRAATGALTLTRQSARLCCLNPPVTAICDAVLPPATQLLDRPHLPQVAGPKPATDPAVQCGGVSCLQAGAPAEVRGTASHSELKQAFVDQWIIPLRYLFGGARQQNRGETCVGSIRC